MHSVNLKEPSVGEGATVRIKTENGKTRIAQEQVFK